MMLTLAFLFGPALIVMAVWIAAHYLPPWPRRRTDVIDARPCAGCVDSPRRT